MTDTTIGYAVLQIIPSLQGVSAAIDKQLGGTLTVSGKKAGAQFSKGVGDGLDALKREVESAGKAYEKLENRAKDSLGKVRVEEEKLAKARSGGKADQIVAAEERLAKARRDSARATKEAEAHHSALTAAQKRLADGSSDLGGRLGGLSDVAARLGPSVAAFGVAASAAAVGGVAALAAGAVRATRELYDLGAQFDDISDNLRIKTGATGAALDSLNDSVAKIGKTVPLGLGQLGDVVAETNRNLHLTGPELEATSAAIADLGRLIGENVDVRTLGRAFRGFGVDAKDQVPALDSLYQASQRSGISVNELIATASKGGPALRQLGLGFGESAALVAKFEEAGLDGERMVASLGKGLGALAKAGQTGPQALQTATSRIKELVAAGDQAAALDLSNKLFGAKGGAQFFEAIRSGALDLDSLSASMTGTGETIAQASEGTADWAERWQLFKTETETTFKPLSEAVFNFVNVQLTSLSDWISAHHDEIVDFFVKIGDVVIGVADSVHGFVASTISDMGLLADLAAKIVGGMATVDEALDHIPGMGGNQQEAENLRKIQESLKGVSESLKGTSSDVDKSRSAWDTLKTQLHDIGEEAKTGKTRLDALADAIAKAPSPGWFGPPQAAGATGVLGSVTSEEASRLGGASINTSILKSLRGTNPSAKLTSGMTDHDKDAGEHPKGKAIDVDPSRENLAWAWANRDQLSMIIYDDPNYVWYNMHGERAEGAAARKIYGESTMAGHRNHIHLAALSEVGGAASAGGLDALGTAVGTGKRSSGGSGTIPLAQGPGGTWTSSNPEWAKLIQRESGGNPSIVQGVIDANTGGNEASGLFQIAKTTWAAYGGKEFAAEARLASPEQQAIVAARIFGAEGVGPWGGRENEGLLRAGLTPGSEPGTLGGGSSGLDLSRLAGAGQLINAFGAGFEPGIGTPGYNEYGDPGYYRTDPKAIRQAERRQQDSQQAIADADEQIADAKKAQADVEDDILATAEQRAKADKDVRDATRAAARAREDAQDAQEALAEAQKGRFTEAKKEASKSKGKGSGFNLGSSLSDIGSALGEFAGGQVGSALSVLGVGDSPGWLKAASTFLGGISIGGDGGSSDLKPLAALPDMAGVPGAETVHGGGYGAPPGPTFNTTINARDAEDAMDKWKRQQALIVASKLGHM